METRYNFQVRAIGNTTDWQEIKPIVEWLKSRQLALEYAERYAGKFCAEVRLTEGPDCNSTSGTYIRKAK